MTREEAILDIRDNIKPVVGGKSLDMAIEALEQLTSYEQTINKLTGAIAEQKSLKQEPCEDVISRQAVQDYIAKYLSQYLYNDVREAVEVIDEYIGELPSVKPQEPILDKIKAEIDRIEINGRVDEYTMFIRTGEQVKQMVLNIIDKYRGEVDCRECKVEHDCYECKKYAESEEL